MALYGSSVPTSLRGLLSCCYGGRGVGGCEVCEHHQRQQQAQRAACRSAQNLLPLTPSGWRELRRSPEESEQRQRRSARTCGGGGIACNFSDSDSNNEELSKSSLSDSGCGAAAAAAAADDDDNIDGADLFDTVDGDRVRRSRPTPAGSVAAASSIASPTGSEQQRRLRQKRRQQQQMGGASGTPTTSPSSRRSDAGASSQLTVTDEDVAGASGSRHSSARPRQQKRTPKSPRSPQSQASVARSSRGGGSIADRMPTPSVVSERHSHSRQSAAAAATQAAADTAAPESGADLQSRQLADGLQIEDFNDGPIDETIMQAYGEVRSGPEETKGPVKKISKVRKIGTLETSIKYDNTAKVVTVKIIQTHELPRPGTFDFGDKKGSNLKWNAIQVTLALLPDKKQRHRTEIAKGDNPQFDKSFLFTNISSVEFGRLGIRFRAYGCQHKRRKLLMAENVLALASLTSPKNETVLHLPLEMRAGDYSRRDSEEEAKEDPDEFKLDGWTSLGVTGFPELFVGITYNASTGQLAIEIIKGSSFKLPGMSRAPDTYVKISLMASNGHVLHKSKTPSSEGTQNPMWKENFVFPVNKFQLSDITIMVAVYAKKTMNRREIIGWFSIGCNNSGEEELAHWQDMKDARGEPVRRWHRLLQTDKKS